MCAPPKTNEVSHKNWKHKDEFAESGKDRGNRGAGLELWPTRRVNKSWFAYRLVAIRQPTKLLSGRSSSLELSLSSRLPARGAWDVQVPACHDPGCGRIGKPRSPCPVIR